MNSSHDGRLLSRKSLCSGTCMRGTIWRRVDSLSSSLFALKSQQKLMLICLSLLESRQKLLASDLAFLKECANPLGDRVCGEQHPLYLMKAGHDSFLEKACLCLSCFLVALSTFTRNDFCPRSVSSWWLICSVPALVSFCLLLCD